MIGRAPSAAIIESYSVRSTVAGDPRSYKAGNKIKRSHAARPGRNKRESIPAGITSCVQDRVGSGPLHCASSSLYPVFGRVLADVDCKHEAVEKNTSIVVDTVHKVLDQGGFVFLLRRRAVERIHSDQWKPKSDWGFEPTIP